MHKVQHLILVVAGALILPLVCSAESISSTWSGRSYRVLDLDQLDKLPKDIESVRLFLDVGDNASLASFRNLRHASIGLANHDEGSYTLELPDSLEYLQLSFGILSDSGIVDLLASHPSLKSLGISFSFAHPDALAGLKSLSQVAHLELYGEHLRCSFDGREPGVRSPDLSAYSSVLSAISAMESLISLHLSLPFFPTPGLRDIAMSSNLQSFTSRRIDDAGLHVLCTTSKGIRTLNLRGNRNVTDIGFAFVHELETLETLILEACRGVGDYALYYISRCKALKVLDLSASSSDLADLKAGRYPAHPLLEEKSLARRHRIELNIEMLGQLGTLEVLRMRGLPSLRPEILTSLLKALVNLEELDVSGCTRFSGDGPMDPRWFAFTPDMDFSFFRTLESLRVLRLDRVFPHEDESIRRPSIASEELLESLQLLPSLEVLSMRGAMGLPARALGSLSKCTELRVLDVENAHFDGRLKLSKELLGQLTELRTGNNISDDVLKDIAEHSALTSLSLSQAGSFFTEETLTILNDMSSLRALSVGSFNSEHEPKLDALLRNDYLRSLTIVADLGTIRELDADEIRLKVRELQPKLELSVTDD